MNDEEYNLEEVYDNQIAPLIEKIMDICHRVDMPMITSFAYANDSFCTTSLDGSKRTPMRFVAAQKEIMKSSEIARDDHEDDL